MNEKGSADNTSEKSDTSRTGEEADPKWMYLNYLTDDHRKKADAYLYPVIGLTHLQKAVEDVVKEIRAKTAIPVQNSPESIEWYDLSYMVFVLDSESGEKIKSVDFWHLDGKNKINKTFKHEKRLKDFGKCSAISYINIRKNKKGEPIGRDRPERELYNWKAHHGKPIEKNKNPKSHENSGTNVGP